MAEQHSERSLGSSEHADQVAADKQPQMG